MAAVEHNNRRTHHRSWTSGGDLMQVMSESILFLLLFSLRQHVRMTRCCATTVAADALLTPYRTRTRSFSLRQHIRTISCRETAVTSNALLTAHTVSHTNLFTPQPQPTQRGALHPVEFHATSLLRSLHTREESVPPGCSSPRSIAQRVGSALVGSITTKTQPPRVLEKVRTALPC